MKRKLAFWNSLIIVVAISALLVFGVLFAKEALVNEAKESTIALTHAYKNAFNGDTTSLVVEDKNIRETIICSDGSVLWDSEEDASNLESHANREEFIAAMENKPTVVIRSSQTFGVEYIYYAEAKTVSQSTYVIRIALKTSSLTTFMSSYIPWIILFGVFAIASSMVMVIFVTNKSLKPLKEIETNLGKIKSGEDNPNPIEIKGNDEVSNIAKDINQISNDLSLSLIQLRKEEEKLSLLLSNVPNPIIAISGNDGLVFANESAKKIFRLDEGKLSSDINLKDGDKFEKDGRTYTVSKQDSSDFTLYVLNDITPEIEAAKQRKEFVDSASHELKTPLTSIIGFNELISMSSKDEKIKDYASKVSISSKRMLSVVQDMLAISSLEEEKAPDDIPAISLRNVANDAITKLSFLAEEKKVTLTLIGDAKVTILDKDAYLIIKNLIENGMLYNVPNGKVSVTLNEKTIIVEDSGIGIAEKDQERIFERFYRIDKSHSRQNGGTGLGLSIVKHAVMKYNGEIKLESHLGYGTKISVTFPC